MAIHKAEEVVLLVVALLDVTAFHFTEIMEDKEITMDMEVVVEEQGVDHQTDIVAELLSIGSMPTTISGQEAAAEREMAIFGAAAAGVTLVEMGELTLATETSLVVAGAIIPSRALEQAGVGQDVIVVVVVRLREAWLSLRIARRGRIRAVLLVYHVRQERPVRRQGCRVVEHVPLVLQVTTPIQARQAALLALRDSTVARQALVHAVVVLQGPTAPILDLPHVPNALRGPTIRTLVLIPKDTARLVHLEQPTPITQAHPCPLASLVRQAITVHLRGPYFVPHVQWVISLLLQD